MIETTKTNDFVSLVDPHFFEKKSYSLTFLYLFKK